MSALAFLLERELIIVLALSGAVIVTIGNFMVHKNSRVPPQRARFILRFGYALTFVSIGLFIVAGFATAYTD